MFTTDYHCNAGRILEVGFIFSTENLSSFTNFYIFINNISKYIYVYIYIYICIYIYVYLCICI